MTYKTRFLIQSLEVEGEDERDKYRSGEGALPCRSITPAIKHMHASIYHLQNEINYDGKDELNLNGI